jgi:hypothetical protein
VAFFDDIETLSDSISPGRESLLKTPLSESRLRVFHDRTAQLSTHSTHVSIDPRGDPHSHADMEGLNRSCDAIAATFPIHPQVVDDTVTVHAVDMTYASRHSTEPHVSELHLCASWIRSTKQSRSLHSEENFDCSTNSATVWA